MQSTTENAIKEANIEMETVKKSITVLSSELSAAKVELPLVNEKVEKLQNQMKEENGTLNDLSKQTVEKSDKSNHMKDQITYLHDEISTLKATCTACSMECENIQMEYESELGNVFQCEENYREHVKTVKKMEQLRCVEKELKQKYSELDLNIKWNLSRMKAKVRNE